MCEPHICVYCWLGKSVNVVLYLNKYFNLEPKKITVIINVIVNALWSRATCIRTIQILNQCMNYENDNDMTKFLAQSSRCLQQYYYFYMI